MLKRILLVEDDTFSLELYEEVFKGEGYDVDQARDGEEGFTKIQKGGYDLILLDIVMPKLDGIGLLKKLQENPPTAKNGPIVLLTNLAHDPVLQEALQRGAKSYIIKTNVTPAQLVEKVHQFLQ